MVVLVVGCQKKGDLFINPSPEETGITFSNVIQESDALNILDYLYFYNGGGVAAGDINNDGLVDIYFSGNQVKNKLYLNKGNLEFEDITDQAGVAGNSSWNTGTIMADFNADGLLDIYVCAVVGINGFRGHNELFINNGDNSFTEKSAEYGLDFDTYSSGAAVLDFDLDGDLDLYLLNHAVHTSESYGKVDLRYQRNYETGDKLLRNDAGKFVDISEEAGIFGGINGYGLGVAVSDFDQNGFPDIYVGNDFHEDDYYYLNNGDGTFTESLKEHFGHTSRFSMGNDVADINRDGLPDLISLDMLPEDEVALKSSEGDDNFQTQKMRIEQFGYHYQFTRNMLYINQPGGDFMETAMLSGVSATDWSWSALFADYDQDGFQDLFVSNGIPKRPNDLDYIKFLSSDQIQNKINNTKLVDQKAFELMPSGAIHNYVFKGGDKFSFENKSEEWIIPNPLISGATAMADFDNDGDIDLVTNNLNATATLYVNRTNKKSSYLKVKLAFEGKNPEAIGTKVLSYHNGIVQYKELFPCRGFQSSSEPTVHFGYGTAQKIDSLQIIWPNQTYQTIRNISVNQSLTIKKENEIPFEFNGFGQKIPQLFSKVEGNLGISFQHVEDPYVDFNREKLIPYKVSDRGPALAIGDLNGDGSEDIFFGGSKRYPSKSYFFKDSLFIENPISDIQKDSIKEDVAAVIADFNSDGRNDLLVGSGGADFFGNSEQLLDSYFVQQDTAIFMKKQFPQNFENASVLSPHDVDRDGDLDVFIGNHTVTGKFGQSSQSFLLKNTLGSFESVGEFDATLGMVTDAIWSDFDNDGWKDLIVVGEWMAPVFFKNNKGRLEQTNSPDITGLWQTISPFDIDGDGDIDYLLGNWGTNSKFKTTKEHPLKLICNDFDSNGQTETVTAIFKEGKYYPLESLDGLASQMVSLRKKFTTYKSFAGKTIEEIFNQETLDESTVLQVNTLESGYLKNENGQFIFVPFPVALQVSPLTDFLIYDFDKDGKTEALVGGNYFGVKPYQGRLDSFPGALIKSEIEVILGNQLGLDFTQKSVRHINALPIGDKTYILVTYNNDKAEVYQLNP